MLTDADRSIRLYCTQRFSANDMCLLCEKNEGVQWRHLLGTTIRFAISSRLWRKKQQIPVV